MKNILFIALIFAPLTSIAATASLQNVQITKLYAYDDYQAAAFLALTDNLPECGSGAYVNPEAAHFNSLYSTILAAFTAGKTVTLQLYNDRIISGRCEVDAIIVSANSP